MVETYKQMIVPYKDEYFMFTVSKAVFYASAFLYVSLSAIVVMFQPLISIDCHLVATAEQKQREYGNVMYEYDPCRFVRSYRLLFLTIEECQFGR
jgi:hypothetical protein